MCCSNPQYAIAGLIDGFYFVTLAFTQAKETKRYGLRIVQSCLWYEDQSSITPHPQVTIRVQEQTLNRTLGRRTWNLEIYWMEFSTIESGKPSLSTNPQKTIFSLDDRIDDVVGKAIFNREISADVIAFGRDRRLRDNVRRTHTE